MTTWAIVARLTPNGGKTHTSPVKTQQQALAEYFAEDDS